MVIAAIILGITSIIVSLFSIISYGLGSFFGIAIGIVGFVCGYVGKKQNNTKMSANIGIIISLIGCSLGCIIFSIYINKTGKNAIDGLKGIITSFSDISK
jgi:uncharacterized BrkB/YihY/UPF0761 family membrane protein